MRFILVIFYLLLMLGNVFATTDTLPEYTDNISIGNKKIKCDWQYLTDLYYKYNPLKENEVENINFYDEKETSWYYQDEKKKKRKKHNYCKFRNLNFLTPELVKNLTAPQYKKLLKDLQAYSVSYPTKQTISKYMMVQWYSMKRAEKYMNVWQDVLYEHPALDYTVVRPPHSYASFQKGMFENAKTKQYLKYFAENKDRIALVGFVSPDCVYCIQQMPILLKVAKKYGVKIKFVNLKEHPELKEKYNIEAIPEIWLVVRGYGARRVVAGLRTMDVIVTRAMKVYEKMTGEKIEDLAIYNKLPIEKIKINKYNTNVVKDKDTEELLDE